MFSHTGPLQSLGSGRIRREKVGENLLKQFFFNVVWGPWPSCSFIPLEIRAFAFPCSGVSSCRAGRPWVVLPVSERGHATQRVQRCVRPGEGAGSQVPAPQPQGRAPLWAHTAHANAGQPLHLSAAGANVDDIGAVQFFQENYLLFD